MAIDKTRQTVQHLRSKVAGAQVSASTILEGEIAVRYSHNDPALMIKDEDNHIVEFLSSGAVSTEIQKIEGNLKTDIEGLSAATVALEDRVEGAEADIDTLFSAETEIKEAAEALSAATNAELTALSGSAFARDEALDTLINNLSAGTVAADAAEITAREEADEAISGKVDSFSAYVETKIQEFEKADEELLIKSSAYTDYKFNQLSGSAFQRDEALDTLIKNLSAGTVAADNAELGERQNADKAISGAVSAFSAYVETKLTELAQADEDNLKKSSAYTDYKFTQLSGSAFDRDEALDTLIKNLSAGTVTADGAEKTARETADKAISGAVSAFSAYVATEIEALKTAATDNLIKSSAYTDYKFNQLSGSAFQRDEALDTLIKNLSAGTVAADAAEKTDRQNADNAILSAFSATSASVVTYINTKLSVVYRVKGSVSTFADLPATAEEGDVWNIVNSGVTDDKAIEGSGTTFQAGANFVWVNKDLSSGYTKSGWDLLGGSVDFSALNELSGSVIALSAGTAAELGAEKTARETADNAISGAVSAFSAYVATEIEALKTAATDNLIKSSAYTDYKFNQLSGSAFERDEALDTLIKNLSAGTVTADGAEKTARETADKAISGAVSAFSAYVETKLTELAQADADNLKKSSAYTDYKFEQLSGSAFQRDEALDTLIKNLSAGTVAADAAEKTDRQNADTELRNVYSAFSADLLTIIVDNEETTAAALNDLDDRVIILSGNVEDIYSRLSTGDSKVAELSAATMAEIGAEKTARETADNEIKAALSAVSAVSVTAIQDVKLETVSDYEKAETMKNAAGSDTGVYLEHSGTTVKIDLTYLSIDCGTF